jgi:hypothetical protein
VHCRAPGRLDRLGGAGVQTDSPNMARSHWPHLVLGLLVVVAVPGAPAPAWAAPECPLRVHDAAVSLDGRIGTTRVRAWVTIERSLGWSAGSGRQPADTPYGLFYETDAWLAGREDAHVGVLRGTLSPACRLELVESDTAPSGRSGTWSIAFTEHGRVTGVRTSSSGVSEPIDFAVTNEPGCDGASTWRTFTDPSSPVTFDYPADWRMEAAPTSVTLVCPNLEDMARGGHWIELAWGSGDGVRTKAPDGRDALVIEPFVTFGDDRWRLVADACLRPEPSEIFCHEARPFALNGMAAFYGPSSDEGRRYGPGRGYLGQGDALRFLFRWERHWLVARADRAGVPDPYGPNASPVSLEGNGVDTRLLRSIRPRHK